MQLAAPLFALLLSQVNLPGTQPGELMMPPEPTSTCGCHDAFNPIAITEPAQSYKATMMALAGRDPLFRAAFKIAVRDRPEITDLCLRCHVPMAWLGGRSSPSDGSALLPEDLESVTCDVCHRMVPSDPPLVGDGQFTLAQEISKRAGRGAAPPKGHEVIQSDYQASSELCATCHSLFNPAEPAHDSKGNELGFPHFEQRTYEEWADSAFAARNISCIDCHMQRTQGGAARGAPEYPDLAVHMLVGGNYFIPRAVAMLVPNLGIDREVEAVEAAVDESLQQAATLTITSTIPQDLRLAAGEAFSFGVRLTNETGHKLPSGYPEGRRVYLEVALRTGSGTEPGDVAVISGAWDPSSGNLIEDPQLRTYETEQGRYEAGTSTRTQKLVFANQVLLDTRIPPEGFVPRAADMEPVGRDYGVPPYRHFDETSYTFEAPSLPESTTATVTVTAMYQVTDGHYVDFLLEEADGSTEAADLRMVWEALGRAPPRRMVQVSFPVTIMAAPAPDAGVIDSGPNASQDLGALDSGVDAGARDLGQVDSGDPEPEPEDGCGCTATHRKTSTPLLLLLFVVVLGRRLRPQ